MVVPEVLLQVAFSLPKVRFLGYFKASPHIISGPAFKLHTVIAVRGQCSTSQPRAYPGRTMRQVSSVRAAVQLYLVFSLTLPKAKKNSIISVPARMILA